MARLGRSTLSEAVLEAAGQVLQVLHAASPGGLASNGLLAPVDYEKDGIRTRAWQEGSGYTCASWRQGRRRTHRSSSACGRSGCCSDGRGCGSWCASHPWKWCPWSKHRLDGCLARQRECHREIGRTSSTCRPGCRPIKIARSSRACAGQWGVSPPSANNSICRGERVTS